MKHLLATAALGALALAAPAAADTLREALVSTYRTNPTVNAQREVLRGTDAGVAIARAAGRPQLGASVGLNRNLTRSGILNTGANKGPNINGGLDLSVPLFQGGRVRNSIRAAETRVEAGRALLRAVEGDIFAEATAAYMDVIRDRAIVELNQSQIRVLTTNLEATRDRFEIGDVTRTDVAQSEARLSLARSNLATAQARLAASEENYRRVIGRRPDGLAPPPPLPPLPTTAEEAVRIALVENPDIIATVRQAQAAGLDVRVVRAERLPTVSGVASGDYVNSLGGGASDPLTGRSLPNAGTASTIGLNTSIPLYQGGLPAARIRQAQAQEAQLLEQTVGTERAVVANTRASFASYEASQRAIQSNQVAVSANELALEGARAERSVGTRTVLEVLNAEQELLNSQVALVSARRDAYVAGFQLLNAMGQAESDDLGLEGGALYDPTGNYRRVTRGWNDWAGERRRQPTSTRTVTPTEQPAGVAGPTR
uniref:TolC family outer membrane protein n=1 Tax=uncultured Sphingomonas sp. TaxID=158754 RepID=UPI0025D2F338|nr:TolC family outer membrane protein [uncultured Sphingomonas sp.]